MSRTKTKIVYGTLLIILILGLGFEYTQIQHCNQVILDLETSLTRYEEENQYLRVTVNITMSRLNETEEILGIIIPKFQELTVDYYTLLRKCLDAGYVDEKGNWIIPNHK